MTASDVKARLTKELKVRPRGVCILSTKVEHYAMARHLALEHLLKTSESEGIYLTLNAPYASLSTDLKGKGVDLSRLHFIDGVSEDTGDVGAKSCSFMKQPRSLTELSLVVTDLLKNGDFDFLFVDSLSTLLLYNSLDISERFAQYLIGKMKEMGISGITLSVDGEKTKPLVDMAAQFCDAAIFL